MRYVEEKKPSIIPDAGRHRDAPRGKGAPPRRPAWGAAGGSVFARGGAVATDEIAAGVADAGGDAAIIAVVGVASFWFNFIGVNLFMSGLHSYAGI